jgi:hypothetical protein
MLTNIGYFVLIYFSNFLLRLSKFEEKTTPASSLSRNLIIGPLKAFVGMDVTLQAAALIDT